MTRGILSTVYADLNSSLDSTGLRQIYEDFYAEEEFVEIAPEGEMPETKWVRGTNRCFLGITVNGKKGIIVSVIDNLVKGAAGQAVQNMNLLFGFAENSGLEQPGIYP
jgi:N-acetyl-gamma-glutamyl-phosphate reductase